MPNRIVREGINDSDRMDSLVRDAGWAADCLYRRLLNVADDFGRFDARLTVLKSRCYPTLLDMVRDNDLQRWIAACEKAGLVRIYSADAKAVGEIIDFRQVKRAEKSRFPCHPSDDAEHMQRNCEASAQQMISKAQAHSKAKAQQRAGEDEPRAEPVAEQGKSLSEARSFASGWLTVNRPDLLRKMNSFVKLILEFGKERAVEEAEAVFARKDPNIKDPFAYARTIANGEEQLPNHSTRGSNGVRKRSAKAEFSAT